MEERCRRLKVSRTTLALCRTRCISPLSLILACLASSFKGAFEPVPEGRVERDLLVDGVIPTGLEGLYIRNGPNLALDPTHGYHW